LKNELVLAIVGPTAVGKSELALEVAEEISAEIVSIDSVQIYRQMDIGSAKPSSEALARVPHHMIDVAEPGETMSVADFRQKARDAIADILQRQKVPLLVGGSGLYFRAVVDPLEFPATDPRVRAAVQQMADDEGAEMLYLRLKQLDPAAALRIEPENVRRTVRALEVIELTGRKFSEFRAAWDEYESIYSLKVAGLTLPKEELNRRIDERVDELIASGLVDEVETLVGAGFSDSLTSRQALGYAQLLDHLEGKISLEEAIAEIKRKTRRFARRQLNWFKADPRVRWFEGDPQSAKRFLVQELIGAMSVKGSR